jgi:hypothetical protein
MIVNNKQTRLIVLPYRGKNSMVMGKMVLLPGCNVVDETHWAAARSSVEDKIKRGELVEVKTEVKETIHPQTKKKTVEVKGINLKDLEAKEAAEVVDDTYSLETLGVWKEEESREDVRVAILKQIELVEKHGEDKESAIKGKGKKKGQK